MATTSSAAPAKKLWLVCFSKGGVDALHFVVDNPDFAKRHILGVSSIAAPLLGSDHIEYQIVKLISRIHRREGVRRFLDERVGLSLEEFQNNLSYKYRVNWFKENYPRFPKGLFYTALAFDAKWYEGHLLIALAKGLFPSGNPNDGVVNVKNALFPDYFEGLNLGVLKGHHLVGTQSSAYCQEALLEAHLFFLLHRGLIPRNRVEP